MGVNVSYELNAFNNVRDYWMYTVGSFDTLEEAESVRAYKEANPPEYSKRLAKREREAHAIAYETACKNVGRPEGDVGDWDAFNEEYIRVVEPLLSKIRARYPNKVSCESETDIHYTITKIIK